MKIVIVTYSPAGAEVGQRLTTELEGYECRCYLFDKYQMEGWFSFHETEDILRTVFEEKSALLFICAVGIAVRMTAPFVVSKYTDSPVVVMDDMGKFVISLLGGHVGGANELTKLMAERVGAIPVITTSTDLHQKFAVDLFAKYNLLYYEDKELAKQISAAVLNHEKIALFYDREWCERTGRLPCELVYGDDERTFHDGFNKGIVITPYAGKALFADTLTLVPKQITLGIGCRKGVSAKEVEHAVLKVVKEHHILLYAVKQVCSIDLKKDEEGIVQFCEKHHLVFHTFSTEELEAVEGSFSHSEFVEHITGVDNVCERSAVCGSGGELIVPKQIDGRVTVAAAIEKICLRFYL